MFTKKGFCLKGTLAYGLNLDLYERKDKEGWGARGEEKTESGGGKGGGSGGERKESEVSCSLRHHI